MLVPVEKYGCIRKYTILIYEIHISEGKFKEKKISGLEVNIIKMGSTNFTFEKYRLTMELFWWVLFIFLLYVFWFIYFIIFIDSHWLHLFDATRITWFGSQMGGQIIFKRVKNVWPSFDHQKKTLRIRILRFYVPVYQ